MEQSFGLLNINVTRRHVTSVLMLDKSGSMTDKFSDPSRPGGRVTRLQAACEGACRVVDALGNDDLVGVFAFGSDVDNVTDGLTEVSPSSKASLKRQIMRIRAGGRTRFYDTILAGTASLLQTSMVAKVAGSVLEEDLGSFWYILLSDGEDTCSQHSLNDVLQVFTQLRELPQGVLNVVLIGVNLDGSARRIMQRIDAAGGSMTRFVEARNLTQVTEAFDEIVAEIQVAVGVVRSSSSGGGQAARTNQITQESTTNLQDQGPIRIGSHVRCIGHSRGKSPNVSIGDIGVLKARDSDGDYIVDFPLQDNWFGRLQDVTVDLMADRIRPGAIVIVKPSVIEPRFKWGSYKRYMHGMVMEVTHDGIVHVQIGVTPSEGPKKNLWKALLSELIVADVGSFQGDRRGHWPGSLQLGMAVRVPPNLSQPSTGWGGVTRGEVGYVRGYISSEDMYVCDFPSQDGWKGRSSDLEVDPVATLVRPATFVRVRPGIAPKNGWGNVSGESIGLVVKSDYDGSAVTVNFPEHPGWVARLSELEKGQTTSQHIAVCDACSDRQYISGPRYKCKDCADYDLCQSCFDSGAHGCDHAFCCVTRLDSIPVDVPPRGSSPRRDNGSIQPPTPPPTRPPALKTPPVTPTTPKSATTTPSTSSSTASSTIFVQGTPIVFEVGTQVRVVGLRHDTALNDRVGVIKAKLPNDHFLVQLPDQARRFQSQNLEPLPNLAYPAGTVVQVKGLVSEPRFNGEYGAVIGQAPNNRIMVKLFLDNEEREVSLKPDNLERIAEAS